jgi:hypothetical protein
MTDPNFYIATDYYATGEGRTICLLITRAYPRASDYYDGRLKPEWKDGEKRARRDFTERFGGWMSRVAEVMDQDEFVSRFDAYLPLVLKNVLKSDDRPGNLHWSQEFHMNFS